MEVNVIPLTFTATLGFFTRATDISAQKIDSCALKTYSITIAGIFIQDKSDRI